MKRIVEIVPATPGWYARWRIAAQHTMAYPITVWALVEDPDGTNRGVVGVDSAGQWPGGGDNEPDGDFVRYIFQVPESGAPDDVFNPVKSPTEMA
jgi:hypothetical protein